MPQVVDLGPARCPDVDPSDRDEASRTTARPAFDATDTDGTRALSRTATRIWITAYDVSEARKNSALSRVIDQYDRCRGADRAGGRPPAGESPAPQMSPPGAVAASS